VKLENFIALCGADLSKTLHINFYQNWSNIVEVMTKKIWRVFMSHSVVSFITPVVGKGVREPRSQKCGWVSHNAFK